jgi:glycosyltransferase involved in cell wall biosynthesis
MKNFDQVKFSIITVVYNAENTIAKTISSILKQTLKDFEYIIIDGMSTDSTLEIIKRYEVLFDNSNITFHLISEKDGGIYDAMNKGINIASGNWIGILNADDFYESDAIESVKYFINNNIHSELIYGNMNLIDRNNTKIIKPSLNLNNLYNTMSLFHPSIFIKKSIYESYGKYSLNFKLSSDWELILKLYHRKVEFLYLNKTLSNFTSGGAGSGFKWVHFKERLQIRHKYFRISTLLYDLKDFIILIYYRIK